MRIYVLDKDFIVRYVNPSALEISNQSKEDVIDKDISILINHPKTKTFNFHIDFQTEGKLKNSNGENVKVELTISPIFENQEIQGYIGSFIDGVGNRENQESQKILQILKDKEQYNQIQQDQAFMKQLRIIENELDHIAEENTLFQVYYKPLDILSGDTYGTAYLGEGKYICYIIDAMGKGLSASITSIQSSSFINHGIKKAKENQDLDFNRLLNTYLDFIKAKLLQNEIVAAMFLYIDTKENAMEYAGFGMPPLLLEKWDGTVVEIKSNNLPIMDFTCFFETTELVFDEYEKIMMKSDGFDECTLKNDGRPYDIYLQEDFKNSFSASSFIKKFDEKTEENKDDLTMIFIKGIPKSCEDDKSYTLNTDPDKIDDFLQFVEDDLQKSKIPLEDCMKIRFSLNELILNSIEHGNIGISFDLKKELLEKNTFREYMNRMTSVKEIKDKKVIIRVRIFNYKNDRIITIKITDEGDGFDASNYLKYLNFEKSHDRLHGRGILMTENLNDGIFYNKKGNEATLIKIVKGQV
ncbi:MAG: SpoIIE family protein phosphatase [Campylobacterales bacterium]|nr:SpoIIE family protein phosphatase [Campylobacterales bacterium]